MTIVTVLDGQLDLALKGRIENAKCSALEIVWLADAGQVYKSKSLKRLRRHARKLKRHNKRNVRKANRRKRNNR